MSLIHFPENIVQSVALLCFSVAVVWRVWRGRWSMLLLRWGIIAVSALLLWQAGWLTYQTFMGWSDNPISRYLLPPYAELGYFTGYSFTRYWQGALFAIAAGGALAGLLAALGQWSGWRWIEPGEALLFWLVGLTVGWPGVLVAFALSFALLLIGQIIGQGISHDRLRRMTLTWPMVIGAYAVFFGLPWLLRAWPGLKALG